MKKALFILATAALFLTGCNGFTKTNSEDNTTKNNSNTVVSGLAQYEQKVIDIKQIPETAVLQDSNSQYALYVNLEQEPSEDDFEGTYSVWLADTQAGTAIKVLTTDPSISAPWEQMDKADSDAVEVPMNLIGAASAAHLLASDGSKIIVEGCPDARNIWSYIIDLKTKTAKQLPSTEGVQLIDYEKQEIIASLYDYYPEGGRYSYSNAYSFDGKYLRQDSEPEAE